MDFRVKPDKLMETLKPLSIEERGKYITKAVYEMVCGNKDFSWIVQEKGPRKKKPKTELLPYTSDFEEFWTAYPKKVNKRKAFNVWQELICSEMSSQALVKACLSCLLWQCIGWAREDNKWCPNPENYLANERFRDEDPNPESKHEYYMDMNGIRQRR